MIMASKTSRRRLNPNASPYHCLSNTNSSIVAANPPPVQTALTSSPPLLPHQIYVRSLSSTGPSFHYLQLYYNVLPQTFHDATIWPGNYFSGGFYPVPHETVPHYSPPPAASRGVPNRRRRRYYNSHRHRHGTTTGTGNRFCGGLNPVPHEAVPHYSPAAAGSRSFQTVPNSSYRSVGSQAEKKKWVVVEKSSGGQWSSSALTEEKGKSNGGGQRSSASTELSFTLSTTDKGESSGADGKKAAAATSLMIRNIPNDFQRFQMMQYLDHHCAEQNSSAAAGDVRSEYDFFYLPMDFSTGKNKGYAFVNFTAAIGASRFRRVFDDYAWGTRDSRGKICQINEAKYQGKEALVAKFSRSCFRCDSDQYLPLVFDPPRGGRSLESDGKVVGRRLSR